MKYLILIIFILLPIKISSADIIINNSIWHNATILNTGVNGLTYQGNALTYLGNQLTYLGD